MDNNLNQKTSENLNQTKIKFLVQKAEDNFYTGNFSYSFNSFYYIICLKNISLIKKLSFIKFFV